MSYLKLPNIFLIKIVFGMIKQIWLHGPQLNDVFIYENSEGKLLLKYGIYGEETTLDGIIDAAKKNLNETKSWGISRMGKNSIKI